MLRTSAVELDPAWATLLLSVNQPRIRNGLSRFARWSTLKGIPPEAVDDAIVDRFIDDLRAKTLVRHINDLRNNTITTWNMLAASNSELASIKTSSVLKMPKRIVWESLPISFQADVRTNIPRSVAIQIDALYQAARIMMPNVDLAWLKCMKARLHAAPLRHASGPVVTSLQLLDLGLLLMARADPRPERRLTINGASCYRDGLMIAMLAFMPLRRKNLAALDIDRHIIEEGISRLIVIPAAETKTRTLIEFVIPELLLPYLAVYLKIVRPRLRRDSDCKALWASPRGGALCSNAIWKLVCRHTSAELGVRLTPHDVRDAAATTWALEAPSQVAVSRDLLSHKNLRTTQKHYNRARGVEASRSYSQLLGRIKRSAKRN
jgi:integrase